MVESSRDRCAGEDDKTDDVDAAEDDDSVVLSKVLIGDDGTKDRSNVAPELEEGRETSGSLVAHTERTATFLTTATTRDVVLEDTGSTIVSETLTELDNGDQESALGERLSDLAEGLQFLSGRPDTANAILLLDKRSSIGAGAGAGSERTGLLEIVEGINVRAGNVGVVEGSAVEMRVLVSDLLAVLECLRAVKNVSKPSQSQQTRIQKGRRASIQHTQ